MYLSGAGSVYVDSVSLTQAYDYAVKIPSLKHLANASGIFGTNIASQNQMGIYATTTYLRFEIGNSYAAGQYFEVNQTNAIISDLLYHNVTWVLNRIANETVYFDNITPVSTNITSLGKHIFSQNILIGKNWVAFHKGLIGPIQILRFTNIGQSNFDPTTYKIGQSVTGGGAEEVLRLTWNNISGNYAYDESTYGTIIGNRLTGYGARNAATNIITTKEYSPQPDKLIQPISGSQPIYTNNNYWDFDGTNDFLYSTGSLGIIKEFYIKFKPDALGVTKSLVGFNATSSLFMSSSNLMFTTGSTFMTMSLYSSSLEAISSVKNSDWNILVCSDPTGIEANQFKLGYFTNYWDGAIQRFIGYDRQLDPDDSLRILKNLKIN